MGNATILSWNDICSSWMGEVHVCLINVLGKIHFKWIITLVNYCLAFFILNWLLIEKVLLQDMEHEEFFCKLDFVAILQLYSSLNGEQTNVDEIK